MLHRFEHDAVAEHRMPFVPHSFTTALVVIDMQYASACRTTGLGRWLEAAGRLEEGTYRFDRIEQLVVPNILRLLTFFREHDLPRIFVRLGAQMQGCQDLIPHMRSIETAFNNIAGQREYEFLEELSPHQHEPIITKLSTSAFNSSNIDSLARNLGITSFVFTGVSTSQCVDLTARDAADRGYQCVIIEDATAEDRQEYHDATLEQFQRLYGTVMSTDDVLLALADNLSRERNAL